MLKSYLIIAWRAISKNKLYSFLNIFGLAIGLASFILIVHYVLDELSYDRWNPNAKRIYRVDGDIKFGGDEMHLAVSSDPMGATLKKDYPQVEEYIRFHSGNGNLMIKKEDQLIEENRVSYTDSSLLRVFPLTILAGDAINPLNSPSKMMISESAARKYFGTSILLDQIIGKIVETDDERNKNYSISAIFKDMPRNSHFIRDFFLPIQNVDYQWGNFLSNNFNTYVLLRSDTDVKSFNKNFPAFVNKYILPQAKALIQINSMEEFEKSGNKLQYYLTPLTDIHLKSSKVAEMSANGNLQYVYIFSVVALFLILIACINFMNLSTAQASSRAKEVGVRKVLGTESKILIFQFLTESVLMAVFATLISIGFAMLLLPYFNDLAAKSYPRSSFLTIGWIAFFLLIPIILGVVSGLYPAFYMSAFKPIAVLKGKVQGSFNKNNLRSILVVFQFATSILLIIGSIVVYGQLKFIQNKNIGFQKDQVLTINNTGLNGQSQAFRNEIEKLNGVAGSAFTGYLPVSNSSRNDNTFFKDPAADVTKGLNIQVWKIDQDYIPLMKMEIVNGRNFSDEYGTDSTAIILNEEAIKLWGIQGDPLNQKIYGITDGFGKLNEYKIIGVVKNFNFESLRSKVGALGFFYGKSDWVTSFKINTPNTVQLISQIESKYKSMSNGAPFSYRFLDQAFDEMYRTEQRVGKIALTFSVIAIFIACLGLFGLVTFIAERRTKEIGIRKVLGASVTSVIGMLSKDFVKLVIIAALIAFPLGYYLMNSWLQDYENRIAIQWWMFALAGGITILIALLTVSSRAIKAALANPVKSIHIE